MFPEISYQAIRVSWQRVKGKRDLRLRLYKAYVVPDGEKNQPLEAIHTQTLPAKNTLDYYLEFYLPYTFKITSLLSLSEYALYEFVKTNCISVRTPTDRQDHRQSNLILQQAGFYPHLSTSFVLSDYKQYWVWRTQIKHYQTITLPRVVWRVTLDGRGRVVSSYS